MRIVSGAARGRKLAAPSGMDIRPTTDKVKEALFSIIQFELYGKTVLDLFAGTGQLGLEALSRGARFAYFTDSSKQAVRLIQKNIELTGFTENSRVQFTDAYGFLASCTETFDLVFLDPPYEKDMILRAAPLLARVLKPNAVVICESRVGEQLPPTIGRLAVAKEYVYSQIKLTVYREPRPEE